MGSDWRRSRRAHRIIFWVVRAFRFARDRGDRGRTYWREGNHESRPRRLGHVSGRSNRRHREALRRTDYDRDLSDERAIAAVARLAFILSSRAIVEGSRCVTFKFARRDPSTALGMTIGRARLCRAQKVGSAERRPTSPGNKGENFFLPALKLCITKLFNARTRPRRGRPAGHSDLDG